MGGGPMTYVVQAKSDDLKLIATSFKKQEDAIGEMQKGLVRMNDRLKQGWIGLGSEAYFKESDSLVLPAVGRLAAALGEASRLIGAIDNQLGAADQQASSGFKQETAASGGAAAGMQQSTQPQTAPQPA